MSDRRLIYFRDGLVINQPARPEILSDAKELINRNNSVSLSIQIDATHSGLLTNGRVYPGLRVIKSYKSYFSKENGGTANYNKPILKHHDDHEDPIGRIQSAQFIKLKQGDAFNKDFLSPDIPGKTTGKGSGVVRVAANIMQADAIEKILDGRLLTVSSGHSTDKMTCSLCGKQLFHGYESSDKVCEHIPNQYYDDEEYKGLCYGITGNLHYNEISIVTRPAQSSAMIVKVDWEDTKQNDYAKNGDLILDVTDRGRKSCIPYMVLQDDNSVLDLLSAKKTDKANKVLVSFAQNNVLSSVLDGITLDEDDPDPAENEGIQTTGNSSNDNQVSSWVVNTNATSVTSNELGVVIDNHRDSNQAVTGSDTKQLSLGDGATEMTKSNTDASVESLQMEKAQLQLNVKEKDKEIADLKATLDKKDAEITRLTEDSANMQSDLARDYATLVAKYRILINKPGAQFDSEDAYNSYVDELSKRTVDSLRDTLEDLKTDLSEFEKNRDSNKATSDTSSDMVDTSGEKLESPAVSGKGREDNDSDGKVTFTDAKDAASAAFA